MLLIHRGEWGFLGQALARDRDGGRLPTQAELRRAVVRLGYPNNDATRKSVARAVADSELPIPKGRPGRNQDIS